MSLLSRLLGKDPPATDAPAATNPDVPVEAPPRPDPVARAREEEAAVSQAIAAGDMAAVCKWVLAGSSTRIRQAAARRSRIRSNCANWSGRRATATTRRPSNPDRQARCTARGGAAGPSSSRRISRRLRRPSRATPSGRATLRTQPILGQLEARWRTVEPHATPDLQHEVAQHLDRACAAFERTASRSRRRSSSSEPRPSPPRKRAASGNSKRSPRRQLPPSRPGFARPNAKLNVRARGRNEPRTRPRWRHLLGLLRQAQAALEHGRTATRARLREAIAENCRRPCPARVVCAPAAAGRRETRGAEGLEDLPGRAQAGRTRTADAIAGRRRHLT